MRTGDESLYGQVRSDGSTKAEWREPDTGLSSARRVERSSEFDIPSGIGACETYSSENILTAVIELTSPTMWQKVATEK